MSTMIDERTEMQKKLDAIFLRYVKNGVRLLEEKYGPDWVELGEERWKQEGLDLTTGSHCVLGAMAAKALNKPYADYSTMTEALGLDVLDDQERDYISWTYGFCVPSGATMADLVGEETYDTMMGSGMAWDSIQHLWEEELAERGVELTPRPRRRR